MKLAALERATADDRDFQDVVKLAVACGLDTVEGLRHHFHKFFPDQELPPTAELRLQELVLQIRASSST